MGCVSIWIRIGAPDESRRDLPRNALKSGCFVLVPLAQRSVPVGVLVTIELGPNLQI